MSAVKLILVALLWSAFCVMFVRAQRQRQHDHPGEHYRPIVWMMLGCACVAFTFTGVDVEAATDAFFGGFPVSIYIKYFAMTQGIFLYLRLLHVVHPLPKPIYRSLIWLNPLALLMGAFTLTLLILGDVRSHPETRYYVSAARDSIVAVYMLYGILPINAYLFRHETVPTMRIKHILNTVFCLTYVGVAVSSLVSLVVVMFDLMDVNHLLPIFLPLTYLVYALFLTVLVPHRWIAVLLFPARLYTYIRLRRLWQQVQTLAQVQFSFAPLPVSLSSFGELEFAIYQTVINILDHAVLLQPSEDEHHLSCRLTQFLEKEHTYAVLVRGLARLNHDRSYA